MRISKSIIVAGLLLMFLVQPKGVVFAQDEESFVRRSVISKKDAFVLSAVYPGLGQMTTGQKYKGVSLFLAETVALLFAINSHENYNTKLKVYEDQDLKVFNEEMREYSDALGRYKDLQERNDELDKLNTIRNSAFIAAGVIYAYNIIDALFFSPSASESQRAETRSSKVVVRSALIDRNPGILLSKSF